MHVLPRDKSLDLKYDTVYSAAEGRAVSNYISVFPAEQISIVIPSGTSGFEVWINNSNEYTTWRQDASQVFLQGGADFGDLSNGNVKNPSFSANWVDITTYQNVTQGGNAFFIEGAIRYVRLQGASVTGSASAAIGSVMTNGWYQG